MNKLKILLTVFTAFLILTAGVTAQAQKIEAQKIDSITNKELKKVATVLQQARVIQREANQKLRKVVKETDMKFIRYQTIMRSKQNPKNDTVDISKEEQKTLKEIRPQLAKINRESKKKFREVIKEQGLTRKRLQQIVLVVRSNPKVAQRFQKIRLKQMKSGQDNS